MFTMMDCTTQVSIASWLILWKHMEANVDLRTNKTLLRKWLILHYVFGTAVIQCPGDFFDPFREKEKSQTGSQVHSTHLSDTYCLTSHVFLRWSSLILYCTTLNASETLSHYIITSTCTDILRVHICADPSFKSNPQRHLPEQIVPLVFHTCTHTVASLSWHAASPAYCLPVIIKPTHVLFLPCINLWNHSVSLTHSQLSPTAESNANNIQWLPAPTWQCIGSFVCHTLNLFYYCADNTNLFWGHFCSSDIVDLYWHCMTITVQIIGEIIEGCWTPESKAITVRGKRFGRENKKCLSYIKLKFQRSHYKKIKAKSQRFTIGS